MPVDDLISNAVSSKDVSPTVNNLVGKDAGVVVPTKTLLLDASTLNVGIVIARTWIAAVQI